MTGDDLMTRDELIAHLRTDHGCGVEDRQQDESELAEAHTQVHRLEHLEGVWVN